MCTQRIILKAFMFSDAVKSLQQFVLYNFVSLGEIFTGKLKRGDGGTHGLHQDVITLKCIESQLKGDLRIGCNRGSQDSPFPVCVTLFTVVPPHGKSFLCLQTNQLLPLQLLATC